MQTTPEASNRSTLLMFKQLELVLSCMKASIKITSLLIQKCVCVSRNAEAEISKHQLRSVNAACLAVSPVSARRRLFSGTGSLNQLYFYAPVAAGETSRDDPACMPCTDNRRLRAEPLLYICDKFLGF
jgi:hypothetical protein